ncbi:MAG: ROK family protein [Victivallaceae bacterium]|nr:ROK family protein [Victivallaceae bacterium]
MSEKFLLGFDIGGTKCAAILGQRQGNTLAVLAKTKFATASCASPADCIRRFVSEMKQLLAAHAPADAELTGLGISCGGPLDSRRGIIQSPPNLPGWDDIPVVEMLRRDFDCPVRLQNDANACAVAEWKYGAGRGTENMIFLTFGTGLGAGLILDGKLYSGTNDMAGEVGHIRLAEQGPVGYGKRGSFEGFCSGGGLVQLAATRLKELRQQQIIPDWARDPESVTAKTVGDAAESGDEIALGIYRECGAYLGRGLAVLVDILNPERIVLGSIFTRSEALLRDEMTKHIRAEALPAAANVCSILPAALGESIGDIAALSLADC